MSVARLVLPALRWRPETGFVHEAEAAGRALDLGVGGFIIFGPAGARADEVADLTSSIRKRAGRPLLLAADLERGAGQQARRLTDIPPPAALASLQDDTVVDWAGATTGREAGMLGLNWVLAPVCDLDLEPANPIVQTRAFGADPNRVASQVARWVRACEGQGVLACAKHYPGHGRTREDSHDTVPRVEGDAPTLAATDLRPFAAAVEAGVAAVMTAHVAFPAWDPSGVPATCSAPILRHLRESLGFEGLIVTDALIMAGARGGEGPEAAALSAVAAGCDLLLYPPDPAAAVAALQAAVERDAALAARTEAALERYASALARVTDGAGAPPPPALAAGEVANRLLAGGMVRGAPPALSAGVRLEIVDDDAQGWYPPGPSDLVRRALAMRGGERHDGALVVLAFAEPRAGKGRAGFSAESRARLADLAPQTSLVVLFGPPRLAEEIPGTAPVLLAWHRQPLMQEAVARWLAARTR